MDYSSIEDFTTTGSNSYDDWKYAAYVTGETDNSAYNYDEIPDGSYTRWNINSHFPTPPDGEGCYEAEADKLDQDLYYSENNADLAFIREEPTDGDSNFTFSVGLEAPVPSYLSASLELYSDDLDSIDFTDDPHDYDKWDIRTGIIPSAQDDTRGVYLDVEAKEGELGYKTCKLESRFSWEYVDYCQDTMPVVATETDTASGYFYPEVV